jgi:hypothetical protein
VGLLLVRGSLPLPGQPVDLWACPDAGASADPQGAQVAVFEGPPRGLFALDLHSHMLGGQGRLGRIGK